MSVSPMALELHRAHIARINKWWEKRVISERVSPPEPMMRTPMRAPIWAPIWGTVADGMAVPDLCFVPPTPAALGLSRSKEPPLVVDIQRTVNAYFNLSMLDLLSQRRTRNVAEPRQIAMYLCKTLTTRSLPDIGRRFGGRDHTTVLHAVRKIERLYQEDPAVRSVIDSIKRGL